MTFATLLADTAFEDQPQGPATTCRDGQPAIGWTWDGRNWEPTCAAHTSRLGNHRIYNSEFMEDE